MFILVCIGWPASRGLCRSRACRVSGSRTPSMTRGLDVLVCGSCVDRPRVHGGWDAGSAGHWDGYGILYVSCGRSSQQDGSIAERRSSDFVSQTSSKAAAEFSGTRVRFIAVKTRVLEAGCIRLFILVIVAPLLLLLLWFASLSLPFLSAPVSDS